MIFRAIINIFEQFFFLVLIKIQNDLLGSTVNNKNKERSYNNNKRTYIEEESAGRYKVIVVRAVSASRILSLCRRILGLIFKEKPASVSLAIFQLQRTFRIFNIFSIVRRIYGFLNFVGRLQTQPYMYANFHDSSTIYCYY